MTPTTRTTEPGTGDENPLTWARVPVQTAPSNSAVSVASLRADLLNARAQNTRFQEGIRALENRLSESLGATAFRESGLGAPDDIRSLQPFVVRDRSRKDSPSPQR